MFYILQKIVCAKKGGGIFLSGLSANGLSFLRLFYWQTVKKWMSTYNRGTQ